MRSEATMQPGTKKLADGATVFKGKAIEAFYVEDDENLNGAKFFYTFSACGGGGGCGGCGGGRPS